MRNRLLVPALLSFIHATAQEPATGEPMGTEAAMDAVMATYFKADEPGGVALLSLDGNVIWSGAVGLAEARSRRQLDTSAVFRIGSLTKQFTATAILQLVEEGSVQLDADIRRYIDFPKKDQVITVEQLLTHTSGIPNYTDLPSFTPAVQAREVTVKEIVATFKDLPLEFAPGTKWNYSNSGYILLGLIIEKASGLSWEAYMQEFIFTPAGMTHTSAASTDTPLPGEVAGHMRSQGKWAIADPISLTWPYAAGAVRSTVGDLNRWNTAVMSGQLVPPTALEKAFKGRTLPDGTDTHYGFGWMTGKVQGTPTLEHGGHINGFSSHGLFVPQDAVYAVVLTDGGYVDAGAVAAELAAVALGTPYPSKAYGVDTASLRAISGVYVSEKGVERYLTVEDGRLWSQRQGGSRRELRCVGQDQFRFVDDLVLLDFQRAQGKVTGARLRMRMGDEQLTRTEKPLPVAPTVVPADPAALQRYAGVYELRPGFNLTFRADGARFFVQATGQQELEAFTSGPTTFFLKEVEASMTFFPEADGKVKRMVLYQGGAEMEGKRIK